MAHIASNIGQVAIPLLAIIFFWHIIRGKHHHAFVTLIGGALAVAFLTGTGTFTHLLSQIGTTLSHIASQLVA